MKKLYIVFSFLSYIIIPAILHAQTWKPLGPDENYNPSITYTAFTNIATAPDGTPYIAYNDNSHDGKLTVKKFDGSKWLLVGPAGFTEYYALEINLSISPDGTPYVTYIPIIPGQGFVSAVVKKLSGNAWVDVGFNPGSGINPALAFAADGTPYITYNNGTGVYVEKFTEGWASIGDLIVPFGSSTISGNSSTILDHGSKLLIAADGTPYLAYSASDSAFKISVKKLVSGKWQLVGNAGFTKAGASNVSMALAANGTIYVAYRDSVNMGKAMVQQFANGTWSLMTPNGLSKGAVSYLDLSIGADQKPYLLFNDAGNAGKATVKQLNGSNWVDAGTGIISSAAAKYDHIAIANDGTAYVAYQDLLLYDKVMVKKFTANQWADVGEGGVSQEGSVAMSLKITKAGSTLVSFNDAAYGGSASVKQFQSGAWQYVGQPGISKPGAKYLNMDTAPDGTPYIIYKDTSSFPATVKKFSGAAWVQVGGPVSTGGYDAEFTKISIAPDGTPFVAYSDFAYAGQITVQKYASGAWALVGLPAFSNGFAANINIAVDNNTTPYVAYTDVTETYANVKKFTGGSWVTVGTPDLTSAGAKGLNLAIGPDGTPYIAYFDVNKGKIAVEAFTNNAWTFVGGQAASDSSASTPKLLFDQNGQLFISFLQSISVISPISGRVKKLVQDKWIDVGSQDIVPWNASDNALAITPSGDLVYAYLNPQLFVRTQTSDNLAIAPVIKTCTPDFGGTGTISTITGFNFNNTTAVKFGQSPASSFTVVSPTLIIATVGPGASGLVSVTTPYGTGTYENFTFSAAPPVITSFSTHSGDINATVTIQGKNFGATAADNIVYFGAVKATILSANDNTIQVAVPAGSTYQPLSVTTRQLTAYAASPFDVTFKGKAGFTANSFAAKQDYPTIQNPSGLLIADIDNDGKPDVIATYEDNTMFKNASTKNGIILNAQPNITEKGNAINGVDLDGDGKIDIVSASSATINAAKNISTGSGFLFTGLEFFEPRNYAVDIATGDLDGDGRPDVVTANRLNISLPILRNSSASKNYIYFEDIYYLNLDNGPTGVAIADLDGDGKPEIIVTSLVVNTGTVTIYKNNSTPHVLSFTLAAVYNTGVNPQKPVIADIDNDGKPDIIIPNLGSNTVTVYKNQSTTNKIAFAAGVDFTTGKQPNAVCIADLDGDKSPDMAVVNSKDNTVSVFKNISTANNIAFTAKVDYKTGNNPYNVVAGDLNADGAPELVVANYLDNTISVLRNNLITQPATDSITFAPLATVTYGDPDFILHATSTDITNSIYFTSSDSTIVNILPGSKAHIGKTGNVIVTAQQKNGTAQPVTQSLAVLPAKLTVTADDKTKLLSADNPMLTVKYKGFVNGEDSTVFSLNPFTITTTAVKLSPVGAYPITLNGSDLLNYKVTYINGTLTVDSVASIPIPGELIISKAISPNGDGVDDHLNIQGITGYPGNKVIIVNRNGVKIFEIAGYDNQTKVFNGHSNITGALQQVGTYFYLVEYTAAGKARRKTGFFMLKY